MQYHKFLVTIPVPDDDQRSRDEVGRQFFAALGAPTIEPYDDLSVRRHRPVTPAKPRAVELADRVPELPAEPPRDVCAACQDPWPAHPTHKCPLPAPLDGDPAGTRDFARQIADLMAKHVSFADTTAGLEQETG